MIAIIIMVPALKYMLYALIITVMLIVLKAIGAFDKDNDDYRGGYFNG